MLWQLFFWKIGPGVLQVVNAAATYHNDLMEEITNHYSPCIVHFIHLTNKAEAHVPASFPIIIDLWTPDMESAADSIRKMGNLAGYRMRARATVAKIQHLSCFLTLIVLPGFGSHPGDLWDTTRDLLLNTYRAGRLWTLQIFLRQDFCLGLEFPLDAGQRRFIHLTRAPTLFPETVILLCWQCCNVYQTEWQGISTELDIKLFPKSSAHLPNIILLLLGSSTGQTQLYDPNEKPECQGALTYCWYCHPERQFLPLDCSNSGIISCAERKISQFVNQVPWLGLGDVYDVYGARQRCPSLSPSEHEFCSGEEHNIVRLALGTLNNTNVTTSALSSSRVYRVPGLSLDLDHSDDEIVAPAESLDFDLFTSDSVYMAFKGATGIYPLFQPFCKHVWVGLIATSVAIALTLAGLVYGEQLDMSKLFTSLYSVMCVPLGLTQNFPLIATQGRISSGGNGQVVIFIWALWLVVSTFYTNNYGAVFNSNYMMEPVYARNWTSDSLWMDNYTIFVGFEEPPLETVVGQLVEGYYLSANGFNAATGIQSRPSLRQPSALLWTILQMARKETRDGSLLGGLLRRVKFVPVSLLKQVTLTHLTRRKTLYVTPTPFAHSDWLHFRRAMKSDKNIKFTQSPYWKQGSLETYTQWYGFTKGLHQRHKENVPRRLEVIVSSGLLGMWRKWKSWRLQLFSYRGSDDRALLWLP